ncbi:MAG TPA: copper-binding protein [Pyrinomonadaceae bacterium]|nr:copper-binding protein [Pyrinomonadaceae bacterium]
MRFRLLIGRSSDLAQFALLLLVVASFISCNQGSERQSVSGPAAAVQTTSYQATGVVKSLNPSVPSIEIEHGDIQGLMPAMKMDFHVQDRSLLNGLAAGDRIQFTIENGVGGLKITQIKKL